MMHEDILPLILGDESEAPLIVEPFNFSARHNLLHVLPSVVGRGPRQNTASKSPIQHLTPANGYVLDPRQFATDVKSSFAPEMAKFPWSIHFPPHGLSVPQGEHQPRPPAGSSTFADRLFPMAIDSRHHCLCRASPGPPTRCVH